MQDVSDEEQAAMALKLMDNVKQLIVDTVLDDIKVQGPLFLVVRGIVQNELGVTMSGSPINRAVKQIIIDQMGKY